MNNRKLYKCNSCSKEVPIRSKGLCSYCSFKSKGSQTKNYTIKQQTEKNREKKRNKTELMKPYWEYHLENSKINPYCENCGCRIQCNINNIAHIIPKRSDSLIMDNLQNCAYLCASINGGKEIGCHEHFDRIAGTSSVYLMPVWKKMVERYLTFKDKVLKYNKYIEMFEDYLNDQ